jgi:hypothetical protein
MGPEGIPEQPMGMEKLGMEKLATDAVIGHCGKQPSSAILSQKIY